MSFVLPHCHTVVSVFHQSFRSLLEAIQIVPPFFEMLADRVKPSHVRRSLSPGHGSPNRDATSDHGHSSRSTSNGVEEHARAVSVDGRDAAFSGSVSSAEMYSVDTNSPGLARFEQRVNPLTSESSVRKLLKWLTSPSPPPATVDGDGSVDKERGWEDMMLRKFDVLEKKDDGLDFIGAGKTVGTSGYLKDNDVSNVTPSSPYSPVLPTPEQVSLANEASVSIPNEAFQRLVDTIEAHDVEMEKKNQQVLHLENLVNSMAYASSDYLHFE